MTGKDRDSILFVAPNSYVLRNWIASGLADLIREELSLDPVFVSHFVEDSFYSASGQRYLNYHVPLTSVRGKQLPEDYPEWFYALYYLRLRSAADRIPYGGGQLLAFSRKRDPVFYALRLFSAILPPDTGRRAVFRRLIERAEPRAASQQEILRVIRPKCVVVGTPGMLFLDQLLGVAARRMGVPVHCVVNSWDNLVSRGPMIRRPDSLMVWNRHMRRHATTVHGFDPAAVHVVGSLQFSRYVQPASPGERAALYERINLRENERFLVYLTSAAVPDYEAEDIVELRKRLDHSEFGPLTLVVRVHPQADPRPFLSLAGPRVHVDVPPRFADQGGQGLSFGETEMRSMAALLTSAEVVFASTGTTALLEAVVLDCPAVQLRWMDAFPRRWPEQVGRVKDYQAFMHFRDLAAADCHLATDEPEALIGELRDMLRRSAEYSARRSRAAEEFVALPMDEAPRRVIETLRRLIGDAESPAGADHWTAAQSGAA